MQLGRTPDATATIAFFHAHPDDEAIFTGGTMRLLADSGARVVLVLATSGEQGRIRPGAAVEGALGEHRWRETIAAAEHLGAAAVHTLGYEDSGMDEAAVTARSFVRGPVDEAAGKLAAILDAEEVRAFVTYDANGIYGHPDHVHAHRVGAAACARAGIDTVYDVTVDREYLHFVETHLVTEAGGEPAHAGLGMAASSVGLPSVLIDPVVDVRSVLDVKRAAMAAHASQISETTSAMRLSDMDFGAVYGFEWYARRGPAGPLEDLPRV